MVSYSKSVKSYADVHQVFEAAGKTGGVDLKFDTPQQATVFAQRANAYRVLLRKQNEALGRDHASEFDHLMVRRKAGEPHVRIEPRGFNFIATTLDGQQLDLDRQTLDGPVKTPFERSVDAQSIDDFLAGLEKNGGKP